MNYGTNITLRLVIKIFYISAHSYFIILICPGSYFMIKCLDNLDFFFVKYLLNLQSKLVIYFPMPCHPNQSHHNKMCQNQSKIGIHFWDRLITSLWNNLTFLKLPWQTWKTIQMLQTCLHKSILILNNIFVFRFFNTWFLANTPF